jgi:hypothetical protein
MTDVRLYQESIEVLESRAAITPERRLYQVAIEVIQSSTIDEAIIAENEGALMASSALLRSRNSRQWMLSTAFYFLGSDFNRATDSTNEVRFDVRPGTLFLRGALLIIAADSSGDAAISIGVESDPNKLESAIDVGTATGMRSLLAYTGTLADDPFNYLAGTTQWYPDPTTMYVTYDAGSSENSDGEYLLQLEYIVQDRANENYG